MSTLRLLLPALILSSVATSDAPPVSVGSPAPPFRLEGNVAASSVRDAPTLIAFVDFADPAREASSKSEIDAIRFFYSTHAGEGLRAVVVDAAPTVYGKTVSLARLTARVRDWKLETIPVIQDHETAGLARRYGVTGTPCVFLLDGRGIVRGRWDGFVLARELEATLGTLRAARPGPAPATP